MLKQEEVENILRELAALALELQVFAADSDGGAKVTRSELKAIGKRLLQLGLKVLVDVVD